MKRNLMEKINQAIAEIIEVGKASEITLGSTGDRYETVGADLYYA
jgi:hypothetical protein